MNRKIQLTLIYVMFFIAFFTDFMTKDALKSIEISVHFISVLLFIMVIFKINE